MSSWSELWGWVSGWLPEIRLGGFVFPDPVVGIGGLIAGIYAVIKIIATLRGAFGRTGLSDSDIQKIADEVEKRTAALNASAEIDPDRKRDKSQAALDVATDTPEIARKLAKGDLEAGYDALEKRARAKAEDAAREWRELGALAYDREPARALNAYREAAKLDKSDMWALIYLARFSRAS